MRSVLTEQASKLPEEMPDSTGKDQSYACRNTYPEFNPAV
jgi:hypothetical protein